jgi:magnesium chelatase subunit I
LQAAKERLQTVDVSTIVDTCVRVGTAFEMQGHRGDLVMLTAARALAARENVAAAPEHLRAVAQLALQHRRKEASQGGQSFWRTPDDDTLIEARLRG